MRNFASAFIWVPKGRTEGIREHIRHHNALIRNGIVAINEEDIPKASDVPGGYGMQILVWQGDDAELWRKENAGTIAAYLNAIPGGWILDLSVEEYISGPKMLELYSRRLDCELDSFDAVVSWPCDRMARGFEIKEYSGGYDYMSLSAAFPVATQLTGSMRRDKGNKLILRRKKVSDPKVHPKWINHEVMKWHGNILERLDASGDEEEKKIAEYYRNSIKDRKTRCLFPIWDTMHGWFDFSDIYTLAMEKAKEAGGQQVFVEVGVWMGKSASCLCMLSRAMGVDASIYLVDMFRGNRPHVDMKTRSEDEGVLNPMFFAEERDPGNGSFLHLTVKNMSRFNMLNDVNFIQAPSVKASKMFEDAECFFVFIDASHEYKDVANDLSHWIPKVKPGGILAGHDWDMKGVSRAVLEKFPRERIIVSGNSWMVKIEDDVRQATE